MGLDGHGGIEWQDGTKIYRFVVPRGIVTDAVETNFRRGAAADLPITFGVMSETGAQPFYMLTNDPAFAAA